MAVEPGRSLARLQNGTQARHHVRDLVADPESVRRLLHGSVPRAVLRRELSALLVDGAKLGPCRLTNAKFKSGRVEAHLDLFIQRRSEPGFVVCPCQVSWEVKGAPTRFEVPVELSGGVPPEIASRFRSLEAEVTAEAMRIEVSPFDPKHRSFWQLFESGYQIGRASCRERV